MINTSVPVTLCSNMLSFRDTNKSFKLDGGVLKTMTIYKINVEHSNPQDRKIFFEFGKERKFDFKQKGQPINGDTSMIKLLNLSSIMASGFSTVSLLSDPNELCDRLKVLLQQKQARNSSDIFNDGIVATFDKLLENKCMSKKQHKQFFFKSYLLHTQKN